MPETQADTAEAEHRHHRYQGSVIPWYVHVIWVTFWIICVFYVLTYLFPALRVEWLNPP